MSWASPIEFVGRKICPSPQRVVAAAGVVGHVEGVAIHLVVRTCATDQRVITAAGVVGDFVGVAVEEIDSVKAPL